MKRGRKSGAQRQGATRSSVIGVMTLVAIADIGMSQNAQARDQLGTVFDKYHLTPTQMVMLRQYIGQTDENTSVVVGAPVNGAENIILRDKKTNAYKGEVTLSVTPAGEVKVYKITGAEFDHSASIDLPLKDSAEAKEEAEKVLAGSEALNIFNKARTPEQAAENGKPELTAELPAIKMEAGADYGKVREATATFQRDGSYIEYGLLTKLGAVSGEAKAGLSVTRAAGDESGTGYLGAEASAGAQAMVVAVYANYYGVPSADAEGHFTHPQMGLELEGHTTLADFEAKAGCESDKPCGVSWSAGLLGVGAGFDVEAGEVGVPVKSAAEIEAEEKLEADKMGY